MDTYIEKVINHIEDNLFDTVNIEKLSRLHHISIMQLYRDFYSCTGHTFKEYLTKRRLSTALSYIKHSDMSLIDTAYNCGYSSEQSFCRTIKRQLNITSTQYKESNSYFYFPKFNLHSGHQIKVETETIPETIRIKFYHSKLKGIEDRTLRYFFQIIPEYSGRIFGKNGFQNGNKFCYELYIENTLISLNALENSDFCDIKKITSKRELYAKVKSLNIENDINNAWDYIYSIWLKNSMFEQNDTPYFEEYIHKHNVIKKLELYIPIKKKADSFSIKIIEPEDMLFLVSTKRGIKAEEKASKEIINYLRTNHSYILKNTNEFYIEKNDDVYSCGVRINSKINLQKNCGLSIIEKSKKRYAVYSGECVADSEIYKKRLLSWINENGFESIVSDVFCIHLTDKNFDQKNIITKVFVNIKDVKK